MKYLLQSRFKRMASAALTTAAGAFLLTGCATERLDLAPPSSSQPWTPTPSSGAYRSHDFTLPVDPDAAALTPPSVVDSHHDYSLSELINLAQEKNPDTRIAWEQARQAALAVGMVEATFLPMLSASVVAGYQKLRTPLPRSIGNYSDIDNTNSAVVPALGLQWLLFDFGQRSALAEGTKNVSWAANVAFNGIHQKIIQDVTLNYHLYGAALSRTKINAEMLENSRAILDAAQDKRRHGIATVIEVAQAEQLVAQAQLNTVLAEGREDDSRQALLRAVGLSPLSDIRVAYNESGALPETVARPTEDLIRQALAQRPDVLASYATAQAARSAVKATEADFLPKVYLAGAVASGHGRFETDGLPTATPHTSSSNILVGVSVPLYDGGIRLARVQEAASRLNVANENLQKIQDDAYREIVVASNTLRSALESNRAAVHLVKTAGVTFDAALDAYRHGVGTITVANEAANGLLTARQMGVDARAAAFVAAANLAFVMGKINSPD